METPINQGPVSARGLGQPAAAPTNGTPANGPTNDGGQAADDTNLHTGQAQAPEVKGQAPAPDTKGQAADTFLTLDDIEDPNVRDAVAKILGSKEKEMQGAFTKKTQAIASEKQKIEAYNAFLSNPEAVLKQVAQQYGYQLNGPGQQAPAPNGGQTPNVSNSPLADPTYEPKTWGHLANDIGAMIVPQIVEQIQQRLGGVIGPLYQNVEKITSDHVEQQLDAIDGNWRMYEDEIKSNMKAHPTLIKDAKGLKKLYMISIPDEVLTANATQAALHKITDKTKTIQTGSKTQTRQAAPGLKKVSSFQDAVDNAKQLLAKQGGT